MFRLFPSLVLIGYCLFGWFFIYLDNNYDQPFLFWAGIVTVLVGLAVFCWSSLVMYRQAAADKAEAMKNVRYLKIVKNVNNPVEVDYSQYEGQRW